MPKQTLEQFGQTIKAKHPEYGDMADAEVGAKVLAKYPEYGDMVDASASTSRPAGLPEGVNLGTPSAHPPVSMSPSILGKDATPPSGVLSNLGIGIGRGVAGTVGHVNKLTGGGMLLPVGDPSLYQQRSAATAKGLADAAVPQNTSQAIGKGLEQAGEFMLPGDAEAAVVSKVAPYVGKALPLAKMAAQALGAGVVNKAQGGNFGTGALAGGIGSAVGQGLSAVAPTLAETAMRIRGTDRAYGATPGEAILNETKGIKPGTIVESGRESMNKIGKQASDLAANATQPVDLGPTRVSLGDSLNGAFSRNSKGTIKDMQEVNNQLATEYGSGSPIPQQVPATRAVDLKRGLADTKTSWNPATVNDYSNGAIGAAHHVLGQSIENVVPEMAPLNQRMSSLIPVIQRGTATDLNAGILQRSIGRLGAHTGALVGAGIGGTAGYKEGGPIGALAGGVAGIALPELAASPEFQMGLARMANSKATSKYAIPALTGLGMQFGRNKD